MKLSNESKTLFIPLLAKATMSKNKLFINDPKAEEIINEIDFDFKKLKQTKWLSMYLSVRAAVLDDICNKYISKYSNLTIIHLGCGLDSRYLRVNQNYKNWYDIDYESVINIRKKFYNNNYKYQMIGSSVTDNKWLDMIEVTENVLIIAEGLTMYLKEEQLRKLLSRINTKLGEVYLLFDAYSKIGVKLSKIKNPINKVNAEVKYGINNKEDFLLLNNKLEYINTHLIKKDNNKLDDFTKNIFNNLYCGKLAGLLHKIYEYKLKK